MDRQPLGPLAAIFVRIGNLTFGGGDPTMTALQRELVDKRGWLSPEQYTLLWSLARITPGTNVLAFCAGAGWLLGRWPGALIGAFGSCVPAAVLVAWLAAGADRWQANPWVAASLRGIAAAVVGMMAAGAVLLLMPAWRSGPRGRMAACVAAAFFASTWLGLSPVAILGAAAAIGWFWPEGEAA